jgi:hypothetical protein
MWDPQHLTTLWASTAFYRDSFTCLPFYGVGVTCEFISSIPDVLKISLLVQKYEMRTHKQINRKPATFPSGWKAGQNYVRYETLIYDTQYRYH